MAAELRRVVNREIAQFRKNIEQKKGTLASLQAELDKLQKVNQLLRDSKPRRATKRVSAQPSKKKKAPKPVDWDAVLQKLPDTFSVQQLADAPQAKGKARAYLHQIVAGWVKEGKARRLERGTYQRA